MPVADVPFVKCVKVGLSLRYHKEVGSNNLVATDVLGLDVKNTMGLTYSDQLLGESVQLCRSHRLAKVDDEVVIQAFSRVRSDLFKVLEGRLNEVDHGQVGNPFSLLLEIQVNHYVAVAKAADFHDRCDDLHP